MTKQWIMKRTLHTILFSIAAIVLCFAIYNITHVLLGILSVEERLAETIGRLIASGMILAFYYKTFEITTFGIRKENFLRGILTGGFMFLIVVANIPTAIGEVAEYPAIVPSLYLIVIVVVEQTFIGIFEEFLFRGLIQNMFAEKFSRYGHRGIVCSILLSTSLFAVVHMLNLFDTPELVKITIAQTMGASFMGFFMGALYYRCRNIWVVVFYHAFVDIAGELPAIFHIIPDSADTTDIMMPYMWLNILANSVFLFAGLFLIRKSKCPSPDTLAGKE